MLNSRKKRRALALLLAFLLASSAVLTYGPSVNSRIPGWNAVYAKLGLSDQMDVLYEDPFTVTFLDVGQGDCALVYAEGEGAMLIDAGPSGNADAILSLLGMLGIPELDYVIATHPHEDHIGSLAEVLKQIPVRTILQPPVELEQVDNRELYKEYLTVAYACGAEVRTVMAGEAFSMGAVQVELVGPVRVNADLNNDSIVARVSYGNTSFLFTGDMEAEEEADLLEGDSMLSADVLKVGHHGSNSSSTLPFLQMVAPAYAVISVGQNNDYGHPHAETLENLAAVGATVLRTDRSGTIVIGSDGETLHTAENRVDLGISACIAVPAVLYY